MGRSRWSKVGLGMMGVMGREREGEKVEKIDSIELELIRPNRGVSVHDEEEEEVEEEEGRGEKSVVRSGATAPPSIFPHSPSSVTKIGL